MHKPFIITIAGAESSGKTTLAMDLAEHFECSWVPEYAREYLSQLDRPYDENDLEIIAERQFDIIRSFINREELAHSAPDPLKGAFVDNTSENQNLADLIKSNSSTPLNTRIQKQKSKILIVDGGMMNLRMWARIKYTKTIPLVEEALKDDVTDLYLLCRPNKEWTVDPLREAPVLLDRIWIYNQYLEELVRGERSIEIVGGKKNKRLKKAIRKIIVFIEKIKNSTTSD